EEPGAAATADVVVPGDARPAVPARDRRLHRDTVADVDAPALGGAIADARDHAERLVPRHEGIADGDRADVLLGVAAADAAGLDAEGRAVVVAVRDRPLPPTHG